MTRVRSFPPIAGRSARFLILGSMPGKRSLERQEYYAHPQNLFWFFMEEILGIPRVAPYAERCEGLKARGIALWDALQTCTRPGSLDSRIVNSTMVPNDFAGFLSKQPQIDHIAFNGAKAEAVFSRHVAPQLDTRLGSLRLTRLPSTSPANASIPREVKRSVWLATLRSR